MEVPENLLYTQEHEWIRVNGNNATVGITQFAQEQLGDIVFVELPEVGTLIEQETPFGVVESVKTVSDLYAPVSGTVTAVNQDLESKPEQVNDEPYGNGWIIEIEIADNKELEKLMSPEEYIEQCGKEQG
ncbi:MAG: glycine cleavage system protein GcvH [Nitrospinae bacterium]|nr:glycine cleavage system protein GcvH [Nitrospinota bacterium]MZH05738.1 glycine cleavage system protein GcvH [Nitrospinota bacterium]MZH15082.1 glycine cleavage system protein GcvH [Nitrospinota bacterium]